MIKDLFYRIKETVSPSPIPPWIHIARREIGVHEIRGGENKRILEYSKATPFPQTEDEVPWCSFFMNWVMKQCGMQRSGSGMARSWLGHGTRLPGYRQYAICVIRRGNSSWQGHVFFALERKNGRIRALGGNQSDAVTDTAWFLESSVISYLWPMPEQSATVIRPLS